MVAHMARLFASQAERAAQDTEETSESVVTKSTGQSLKWNNRMNSKEYLLGDKEEN